MLDQSGRPQNGGKPDLHLIRDDFGLHKKRSE
jgi:hypothetical protein